MSRFLTRGLLQARVAPSPFAAATPFLTRARLLPQLHASLFSTEAPQPTAAAENGPNDGPPAPSPPPSKTPEELARMPYLVRRTAGNNLPVYKRMRAGGTRVDTLVKRIEGDQNKLAREIGGALKIDQKDVRVNPTTNHIEIKGTLTEQVKEFLFKEGF